MIAVEGAFTPIEVPRKLFSQAVACENNAACPSLDEIWIEKIRPLQTDRVQQRLIEMIL